MKIKQALNKLTFALIALFFVACGNDPAGSGGLKQASQGDVKRALKGIDNPADKKSSVLGKKIADTKGDIIYGLPRGIDSMVIALTPYEHGFKVFFHSLIEDNPEHVCGFGYVVQNGKVLSISSIADNIDDYTNEYSGSPHFYKGYIESGVAEDCTDYDEDTVWVVNAGFINGFDPLQPYTVIFTAVGSDPYDDLAKIDISIDGKTDKTKTDKNYLGKKTGSGVTKIGHTYGDTINATITPYEKGFRIFVKAGDVQTCFINDHVYQDGAVYDMKFIYDSWYEYFGDDTDHHYHGYIESGYFDSCTEFPVDTTIVVEAARVGFDPKRPYTVKLNSVVVDAETEERKPFEITPK